MDIVHIIIEYIYVLSTLIYINHIINYVEHYTIDKHIIKLNMIQTY